MFISEDERLTLGGYIPWRFINLLLQLTAPYSIWQRFALSSNGNFSSLSWIPILNRITSKI